MDVSPVLASQLEMTGKTWATLQKEGIEESEQRSVDYFFDAPDESRAQALATALEAQGAPPADVTSQRVGFIRKKVVWSVSGTTAPLSMSLDSLRDWVTDMVELGATHDTPFDGWGTEL